MVCAAADPAPVLERFAALPQIVAVIEQRDRWSRGLTIEGVPVDLVVAAPERFGTELVRATGAPAYVAALEPLPAAPSEADVYAALGLPWVPPELREAPFRGDPPALLEERDIRGDLHCHTTWSDGRSSVEEMGRAARERGYDYVAICDHTPAVGAVRGLTADDVRRQAEEIAAANELLAPFRILRGIECDILPDGRLDLPDDALAELDWVQASVHAGQRTPRARAHPARGGGAAPPRRALPQPSHGPAHRTPARRTRSTSSACSRSRSSTASRSRSTASRPGWTSAASTSVKRCTRACGSSARPTRTPRAAWRTCRSRSTPPAAAARRGRTSSTPARSASSSRRRCDPAQTFAVKHRPAA